MSTTPAVTVPSGIPWDTLRRRLLSLDVTLEQIASKHGVVLSAEETGTEGVPALSRWGAFLTLIPTTIAATLDLAIARQQGRVRSLPRLLGAARAEVRRTVAFLDQALARRAAWPATPTVEDLHALRAIDRYVTLCYGELLDAMVRLRETPALEGAAERETLRAVWYAAALHGPGRNGIGQAWEKQVLPPLTRPITVTVDPSEAFAPSSATPAAPTPTPKSPTKTRI